MNSGGFSIQAKGISKRFNRHWIFRNLNFTFLRGNVYAIVGPNGSGKSTLMQILWGQMVPSEGKIEYGDVEAESLHNHISIAAPYMDLVEEMTLREHLKFHFRIKTLRPGIKIEDLPNRMYLQQELDKRVSDFSSGMRQRLKLGLAAFSEADVLFFDEPTTNLDERAREWYRSLLPELSSQAIVIIASNQPEEYPESAIKLNLQDWKKDDAAHQVFSTNAGYRT